MDRKAFLILLAALGFLFGVWFPLTNKLYPPIPLTQEEKEAIQQARQATAQGTNATPADSAQAPGAADSANLDAFQPSAAVATQQKATAAAAADQARTLTLPAGTTERTLTLENEVAQYVFSSLGGGLSRIELKKYPARISRFSKKNSLSQADCIVLNEGVSVPLLTVLGDTNLLTQTYQLSRKDDRTLEASTLLTNGVTLTKTITLSEDYLFKARLSFSNNGENPVQLPPMELVTGTSVPLTAKDQRNLMNVSWYNGEKLQTIDEGWFANRTMGCSVNERRTLYTGGDGLTNVMWVSSANRFFTIATVPTGGGSRVAVIETPLKLESEEFQDKGPQKGLQASLVYPESLLAPGTTVSYDYDIYAGPKEYRTLSKLGISNNLDLVMGFNGFFGFFSKLLLLGMNQVNSILHVGYGLAIIIITIVIKLLFWPLTTASTRSMKRMSQLQPEMNALREKYKDDPQKMNQKLMEFMKENKVNPMGGCWPILIQIPVFIGFYKMLMSAIELRGATFLWATDLSIPDTIFVIPGLNFPINPLPLLMGASMLWQSSLTPPSPGMDPVQQKMFRYMPLIFIFFCYSLPSGLSLYWTVQNLFSILQTKLTRMKDTTASAAPAAPVTVPVAKGTLSQRALKQQALKGKKRPGKK
ncbi:MAG TPA: membrane protein insertase YidC [Verrucomicrobiota bacterium]|jgi:YidC/Oxa1 family membrane protein insertase|nr:membrane protein insertase YidC [Verrucomicrobiota bacterium]